MIGSKRTRIRLRGYDHAILESASDEIVKTVRRTGGRVAGPVRLPTRILKFTVNRSPFVDKKSREQFSQHIHKRLIDVFEPTQQTIEELSKLELASGVEVEIVLQ
jgi:small subunit ribosomal protein S10